MVQPSPLNALAAGRAMACTLPMVLLLAEPSQAQLLQQPAMLPHRPLYPDALLDYWYNCQTREVWMPDKRRWCDRLIQVSNLPHHLTEPLERVIPLQEGQYADLVFPFRATLVNQPGRAVVLDLNDDRQLDVVALLTVDDGERQSLQYLSVALAEGDRLMPGRAVFLGECVQVRSIRSHQGGVMVNLLTPGETDACHSPTQPTPRQFVLNDGELRTVSLRQ